MDPDQLLKSIDSRLSALDTLLLEVQDLLSLPEVAPTDYSEPPIGLETSNDSDSELLAPSSTSESSSELDLENVSVQFDRSWSTGSGGLLEDDSFFSTSYSSISSISSSEQEVVTQEALDKMLNLSALTRKEISHLREKRLYLDDLDLTRKRMVLGMTLTPEEKKELWKNDSVYPYSGDLETHSSDLSLEGAMKLLQHSSSEPSESSESSEPSEPSEPSKPSKPEELGPHGGRMVMVGGKPIELKPGYLNEDINGNTITPDPVSESGGFSELVSLSSSDSSFSSAFLKSTSTEDPEARLAHILDPRVREKVRKALALEAQRKLKDEVRRKEDKDQRELAVENRNRRILDFNDKVQQEHGTARDTLYTSSEALKEAQEKRYQQTHQGEFDEYNTGAQRILIDTDDHRVFSEDGELVTTLKTRKLDQTDKEKATVTSEDGRLLRSDGTLMDTSEAQVLLSNDVRTGQKESWVLTEDDELRTGSQRQETRGYEEFRAAQAKLESDRGYKIPKTIEEAREYGFPEEMLAMHHTTLSDGHDVKGAGEMRVKDGKVDLISNASGHYRPDSESTMRMVDKLDQQGVIDRSVSGTDVKVLNHTGHEESFKAIDVLAGGDDLNRARLLKAERARRKQAAKERVLSELTEEQTTLMSRHKDALKDYQGRVRRGLSKKQKGLQTTIAKIENQLKLLRAEPPDDSSEIEDLEKKLGDTRDHAKGVHRRLKKALGVVDTMLSTMETDLRKAGVSDELRDKIMRNQKRGIGKLSEAESELLVWMSSLVERRRDIQALRKLSEDSDFQQRKETARTTLEDLLSKRKKEDD